MEEEDQHEEQEQEEVPVSQVPNEEEEADLGHDSESAPTLPEQSLPLGQDSSVHDDSHSRVEQTLDTRPSSGMMDEYLKRMHWSRSSPLPEPQSPPSGPPRGPPSSDAMPRWSKTDSMQGKRRHSNL